MPYPSSSGSQVSQMALVPFDIALAAYRELDPHQTMSRLDPAQCETMLDNAPRGACKRCGFPRGQRGYLRMSFPVGHRFFGALIACPDCWPHPFGHAKYGVLPERERRIASLWGV